MAADITLDVELNAEVGKIKKQLNDIITDFHKSLDDVFKRGITASSVDSIGRAVSVASAQWDSIFKKEYMVDVGKGPLDLLKAPLGSKLGLNALKKHYNSDAAGWSALGSFEKTLARYNSLKGFNIGTQVEALIEQSIRGVGDQTKTLGNYKFLQNSLNRTANRVALAANIWGDEDLRNIAVSLLGAGQNLLNVGNQNRADYRYVKNKTRLDNVTSATAYLMAQNNPLLRGMFDRYRIGLNEPAEGAVENERIADAFNSLSKSYSKISLYKGALESSEYSVGLKDVAAKKISQELSLFTKVANKLGSVGVALVDAVKDDVEITTDAYKYEKIDVKERQKREIAEQKQRDKDARFINTSETIRAIQSNIYGKGMPDDVRKRMADFYKNQDARGKRNVALASYLGREAINVAEDIISTEFTTAWGEKVTRNVYDSRRAELERFKHRAGGAGTLIGGLIGGAVGSIIPGGTLIGAGIGSGIGGFIGNLWGTGAKTKFEADVVSAKDTLGILKAKAIFGSAYSPMFASSLTDAGIANGDQVMSSLAGSAMGMRGRMMLGQVGEQEMLYMSMMPNYFRALMAGKTGPELASIYASDLNRIGDSSLRYTIGMATGGQEALAMAGSKYFNSGYGRFVSTAQAAELGITSLAPGFAEAAIQNASENVRKRIKEVRDTAERQDSTVYRDTASSAVDSVFSGKSSSKPTVVNVYIDSDLVASKKQDTEETTEALQNFTIGGF